MEPCKPIKFKPLAPCRVYPKPKPIPQRAYTRNGILFKTIDGKRLNFRKEVRNRLKFFEDVPEEIVTAEVVRFTKRTLSVLNSYDKDIEYRLKDKKIGQVEDQFINKEYTIFFIYERIKPN